MRQAWKEKTVLQGKPAQWHLKAHYRSSWTFLAVTHIAVMTLL